MKNKWIGPGDIKELHRKTFAPPRPPQEPNLEESQQDPGDDDDVGSLSIKAMANSLVNAISPPPPGKFQKAAQEVGDLVEEKNKAYGNSFGEAGQILRVLYPHGVQPDQYDDLLCVVRILDKLKRIATAKDAFGESPYKDICGYGLLGLVKDQEKRKG